MNKSQHVRHPTGARDKQRDKHRRKQPAVNRLETRESRQDDHKGAVNHRKADHRILVAVDTPFEGFKSKHRDKRQHNYAGNQYSVSIGFIAECTPIVDHSTYAEKVLTERRNGRFARASAKAGYRTVVYQVCGK